MSPSPSGRNPSGLLHRVAALAFALIALAAIPSFALAPTVLAQVEPFTGVATGSIPGDGYLLVWKDSTDQLKVRRISAAGFPGRLKMVATVDSFTGIQSVAVAPSGAWAVFWVGNGGADQVSVGGALFDAQDRLIRQLDFPDPILDPGANGISYGPHVAALPSGGYLVAFEVGNNDEPGGDPLRPIRTDVYVMRLDATGQITVGPVLVNDGGPGFHHLTGFGLSGSNVVVSWLSRLPEAQSIDVRARVLGLDLAPVTGEIHVNDDAAADAFLQGGGLAVASDGRFVIVWQENGLQIRAFGPTGTPLGAARAVDPTEPAAQFSPDVVVTSEGAVWVSWILFRPAASDSEIWVRPFDLNAEPTGESRKVATTQTNEVRTLTGGEGGALVTWRPSSDSSLLLGEVVGQTGRPETPPANLALESPELPGFRVWVRITSPAGLSRWGTRTEPCLAEALCVAGAVPDRAEVIVRVVGPKPNGFLWPILSRLTTSQAEVWLEQKASGDVQYYLLPAASPGSEVLPGLFDQDGFQP
ncbi:MAG TPA: hypothetical protein VKM72_00810 [Thermoanaerobaculia bacterium]|nr:hypothetical protein [Thermoanaerobaculia bacterium]